MFSKVRKMLIRTLKLVLKMYDTPTYDKLLKMFCFSSITSGTASMMSRFCSETGFTSVLSVIRAATSSGDLSMETEKKMEKGKRTHSC